MVVPSKAASLPAISGSGGAVSSAAPAATEAGLETLRQGGNAVDAAVAVALALAVVHPQAGNLGGGGFAVVRIGDDVSTLDFREMAPAAAHETMYLNSRGEPIPDASIIGPLAAGVPGSPAGLYELHKKHGKLPWLRVVSPAIRLAEDGFVVTKRLSASIENRQDRLMKFPETAAVWLPGGGPPRAGTVMKIPELGATLRAYAEQGPRAITEGAAAAAVESVSRRYGGVLRAADLSAYRPVWREPVRFRFKGWEVASMSLPASGGIILGQTCGALERLGWASKPRFGAERAHLLAEVWRRAYADRFLLGDPTTTKANEKQLLAEKWIDRRAREIARKRATKSKDVRKFPGGVSKDSLETTHLSVLDAEGNAVSLTTTLNGSFGCSVLVPGLGFLLNNEMDDFATAPGQPNMFGLVQGEANAVAPGKRMLSSMTPTIAWKGKEVLVLGAPGGSRIPTGTTQVFLNLVVDGDELQEAVNRPRIHHQWLPDQIFVEKDSLAPETFQELRKRGHEVVIGKSFGLVNVVRLTSELEFQAASDPRGPGSAGVVNPGP
jgi:gamma-glutamyltranspeptidase/glutathione hydrolase